MASPPADQSPHPHAGYPPKVATGIAGLDDILLGGLPKGRTSLVRGGPGAGKTILALEFIYRGALEGEPGIFVTFEERADILRQNAWALGWDLEPLEQQGLLTIIQPDMPVRFVESGSFDIGGLLAILDGHVEKLAAKRIAVDAADVLLRLFRSYAQREEQLFALHYWLWEQSQTALLTLKSGHEEQASNDRLEYLADCVMHLDNRVAGQIATRRLRVIKYRGSGFLSNEFPCVITTGGIALMPITRSQLGRRIKGKVPTGIAKLDSLLEGGYLRSSCVLVGGSTGAGKTTIASQFALAACKRSERVLYVDFEESVDSLTSSMKSVGLDLQSAVDAGQLKVIATMPESAGVEEHLWYLFQAIDQFAPDHLVVDSISACNRMGSEEAAFDFLVRLLTHCRSTGTTCIYLNQTTPESASNSISGVGISSLVDALIVLEQDWPADEHRRRLLIIKSRGCRHSHAYHQFQITDHGIEIAETESRGSAQQEAGP